MCNGEQQGKLDQEIFEALEASRKHFESLEELDDIIRYGSKELFPDENDEAGEFRQVHYEVAAINRNGDSEVGARRQKSLTTHLALNSWSSKAELNRQHIEKQSASREHIGGKGSRSLRWRLTWRLMPQPSRRSKRSQPNNAASQPDQNVSGRLSSLPATQLDQEERRQRMVVHALDAAKDGKNGKDLRDMIEYWQEEKCNASKEQSVRPKDTKIFKRFDLLIVSISLRPMKDHIYLHLNHLPPEVLKERLPDISETAAIFTGVDVTKEPIPVLPTVVTIKGDDPDAVVPGLMAASPAACASVHGANWFGANFLLDIVVFGRACANRVAEIHQPSNIMQNNAAVFRMQETLEEGCQLIDKAWESFHDVKLNDRSLIWNSDLRETFELENLLINACITMHSSEARKKAERHMLMKILCCYGKGFRSLRWSLTPQPSRRLKRAQPNNAVFQLYQNVSGRSSSLPATQFGQEERRQRMVVHALDAAEAGKKKDLRHMIKYWQEEKHKSSKEQSIRPKDPKIFERLTSS
ncbi:succinate dehydrogenase 1-1 [Actinidia rufa]|uniref:Succinate dehydrogenase 1-1 n=1 Tax=Actinidia rufa TaxID=165716 RepID=A0A7J0DJR2_9ERIC|nr:succinate dehydrogenase 1-1 [Actinidia rufa]